MDKDGKPLKLRLYSIASTAPSVALANWAAETLPALPAGVTSDDHLTMAALWDGRVMRRTVELDAMGSAVWRLIDGRRTAGEIAAALAEKYALDSREAELAVAEFLRLLGRRGAVAVAERGEGMPPAAGRD